MADLSVDLAVDNRDAIRGVKDFGRALDTVVTDLKDIDRAGESMEASLEQSFRDVAKAAKKTGDAAGDGLTRGFKDAKDEAGQSGREAAASFGGGFEDVADFVQETLANALGGFGPAGAAAGVALAAALGTVLSNAQAAQERLADAREAAADLAQTLYENKGQLPAEDAANRLFTLLSKEVRPSAPLASFVDQWVDFGTTLDAVRRTAQLTDTPLRRIITGLGGTDLDETAASIDAIDRALDRIAADTTTPLGELAAQDAALRATRGELEAVETTAKLARDAMGAVGSAYTGAEQREAVQDLADAWLNASTNAEDYITQTEDGPQFDTGAYLAAAEREVAAAEDVKRRLVTLPDSVRQEALRIYREQGGTAAQTYIQGFETSSAADKQRFVNAAKNNGEAAGKQQGQSMADAAESAARAKAQGWGALTVPVKIGTPDDYALRNYKPSTINVPARVFTRNGTEVF